MPRASNQWSHRASRGARLDPPVPQGNATFRRARDVLSDTLDGGDGDDTATVDEFDVLTAIENETP